MPLGKVKLLAIAFTFNLTLVAETKSDQSIKAESATAIFASFKSQLQASHVQLRHVTLFGK